MKPIRGFKQILTINEIKYVMPIPITPANKPIITVSAINKLDTSLLRPPSERITPISLIRSTTDTYVIIPIMTVETTKDKAVNAISAYETISIIVLINEIIKPT